MIEYKVVKERLTKVEVILKYLQRHMSYGSREITNQKLLKEIQELQHEIQR